MEQQWRQIEVVKGPRKGQQLRAKRAFVGWSVELPDGTLELWADDLVKVLHPGRVINSTDA